MKELKPLRPLYKVLYHILLAVAEVLVRLVYPIRTIGRENLPKGSFVLASNHLHAIDAMFVVLARGFGKKMLVMGKEELFAINPLLNFFWKVAGAFPVRRGTGDRAALEEAIVEVQEGRGLLIFPEGTRTKDGNLGRMKSGAFVVAMQTGADIIPCRIWYKSGEKVKPFHRVTVIFGKPMSMEELGLTGEYGAAKLRQAKHLFSARLEELYAENSDKL